jgi:N-ethylmaleimide reductase
MHTGRIGHVDNLPAGAVLVGVSDIKAEGQIYTDTSGMQDHTRPKALTTNEIHEVIKANVQAAKNAIKAGFDGVELHGANGYLIEQFLNPGVNNRTDEFGGSMENRSRFVLQLAREISNAIGSEKVGVRLSPMSTLGDLKPVAPEIVHETYTHLAKELNAIGVAYIHVGIAGQVPSELLKEIRESFKGTIILCNGLTPETAETALHAGFADLVAFGRAFLANPDLGERIATGVPLNQPDYTTLYTPGAKGYTDYPLHKNKHAAII